jgi:hypothetical protein
MPSSTSPLISGASSAMQRSTCSRLASSWLTAETPIGVVSPCGGVATPSAWTCALLPRRKRLCHRQRDVGLHAAVVAHADARELAWRIGEPARSYRHGDRRRAQRRDDVVAGEDLPSTPQCDDPTTIRSAPRSSAAWCRPSPTDPVLDVRGHDVGVSAAEQARERRDVSFARAAVSAHDDGLEHDVSVRR